MTLNEMIEWTEISTTVSHVVNSLEECSSCNRVTECERLSSVEGNYCELCIGKFLFV